MTEEREIKWVEIAGRQVDAEKVICQSCNTLWLDADFDTSDPVVWVGLCPHCGNRWSFVP
jgi:hypothetical protein